MIRDFAKGEDVLNLEINAPAGGGDYVFDAITIIEPDEDMLDSVPARTITQIQVTFNAVNPAGNPIVSTISLQGVAQLTFDDIVITQR